MVGANRFKDTKYTYRINVSSKLWGIKRYLYMRLSCEVVNLVRHYLAHKLNK